MFCSVFSRLKYTKFQLLSGVISLVPEIITMISECPLYKSGLKSERVYYLQKQIGCC